MIITFHSKKKGNYSHLVSLSYMIELDPTHLIERETNNFKYSHYTSYVNCGSKYLSSDNVKTNVP